MQLNKTELKKILYAFNSISNRLMKADVDDYSNVLKRFVFVLESTEIINDYIIGCGETTQDWKQEFSEVRGNWGAIFVLGDSDEEEVANIYAMLKYAVDNNEDIPHNIALGYAASRKYADMLKAFNERVCYVLIQHIEEYLTKIGIDMGLDEKQTFNITNHNGQVNIAIDSASITAQNNVGIDVEKLNPLINAILDNSKSLSDAEKANVENSIEVVQQEIASQTPRSSSLNTAVTTLKAIKGTAEFGAAVTNLISFIQPLL